MTKKQANVRLTTDVLPRTYDLHIKTDLETFVFEGSEVIHLTLKKPTRTITMHAKDLEILSASVSGSSDAPAEPALFSLNDAAETVTFAFQNMLPKGAAQISIAFRGVLNDKMHGFYRSSYTVDGTTAYMATTQFEATDARRAFPCFDEPALKAVFDVSLTVPHKSTVISNTIPTETIEHSSDFKTVHFAPTPIMSTYLLAFVVGDFEYIQKKSKDGVLVRVFVTPGKKHQAKFALDCAAKTVDFFNEYFDIPYPLPVMDLIAIPDFAAGAMENWGAITYRESALLVDPVQSSTMNKQWVALVIAHEIAHQWFGNLVTMQWWTHLWLNEGFASYIEYLAVDHIFPKWDIWTQFLFSDHGTALISDGLKHTHPIEVEVHHPAEISAVFDAVSYSKGASIIRMLAEYLGEKDFRDGLRYYLKKHSYGNTETVDLWNALSSVSGKPVAKIMANWTGASGYPLVSIAEDKNFYRLTQARFFSSPLSQKNSKDATVWRVPVNYMTGEHEFGQLMMLGRVARIPKNSSWLKININESGFYRTSYPAQLRALLADPIKKKALKTRDRLGLIRDILALAETGEIPTHEGLRFATHYSGESEYVVWTEIASRLAKIHSLISREPYIQGFESFVRTLFRDIRKKYSWNTITKDHSAALLKVLVLGSLGKYGDPETITHAQGLFSAVSETSNPVAADLRGIVYDIAAKNGESAEHSKLVTLYRSASLSEEKNRIGRALGSFRQRTLLKKTLAFALSKDVRPQDSVRLIGAVTVNPYGTELAWEFMQSEWKILFARYAAGRELSYLLAPLEVSTEPKHAREIRSFLKKHPAPGTERTIEQVIEHIMSNAAWQSRDRAGLSDFLE